MCTETLGNEHSELKCVLELLDVSYNTSSNHRLGMRSLPVIIVVLCRNIYLYVNG